MNRSGDTNPLVRGVYIKMENKKQIEETNEILGNEKVMKSITTSLKQINDGKGIPLSEL